MSNTRRHEGGFTILEIMIAVTVLVVGILGVLALFPIALKSGKTTIENTNAIIIAQSVEQAIREGIAHRKGQSDDGRWTYFVFNHPGVKDPLPRKIDQARPTHDYYILLPDSDVDSKRKTNRVSAYDEGKVFVYPESDGLSWTDQDGNELDDLESAAQPNGGGNASRADDDKDDLERTIGDVTVTTFEVMRTYSLDEQYFELVADEDLSISVGGIGDRDPIRDYSFAFSIRRAANDASLGRESQSDREFIPANELYEVEVLVFRSFRAGTAIADNPVLRTTFQVHK